MKKQLVLITHAGVFHSDDILSTALLSRLFDDRDIEVIRTPDVESIVPDFDRGLAVNKMPDGRDVIVYDVGRGRFDHHQPDSPRRPGGNKYCGFGLLWSAYGKQYLKKLFPRRSRDDIFLAFKNIDKSFVANIDAHDNGNPCSAQGSAFSRLVANFNVQWNSTDQDPDECFDTAIQIFGRLFENECRYQMGQIDAAAIVSDAVYKAVNKHRQYIILDQYVPFDRILLSDYRAQNILFFVCPSKFKEGEWAVCTVPLKVGHPEFRKPLPDILQGRERKELLKYNWTFVHSNGFIGSALTKKDAIRLAIYAINYKSGTSETSSTLPSQMSDKELFEHAI